jgi:hypothetical protein
VNRVASAVVFSFLVASCGGTTAGLATSDSGSGAGPDSVSSGSGSGEFTAYSEVPAGTATAGASYNFEVAFSPTPPPCSKTTAGACTVNPCYLFAPQSSPADPLPNAGPVTLSGAQITTLSMTPQADGTYTTESVTGQVAWLTGGETLVFLWSHVPGDLNGTSDQIDMSAPSYVSLSADVAFANGPAVIPRTEDLAVSWSADMQAQATDEVSVSLNSGSTQVYCIFGASTGTGVVPAAILQALGAGNGTYEVHSKQSANKTVTGSDGMQWKFSFNVDARARTSSGTASGSVTFQ